MNRLLHIIPSLEIGGAQKQLMEMIAVQQKQMDVSVLVFKRTDTHIARQIIAAGINLICMDFSSVYNPLIIFYLRSIMRGFDVIHVHLFPALYWASLASVGLGVRMIYTEHSTSNSRRGKRILLPIERVVYRQYDHIVSISVQTQEALVKWLGISGNFSVVNNGIDTQSISDKAELIHPSKSVIMVSRFVPAKDQETIIKAMQYVHKDIKLKLVGDGPLLESHKDLAESLGLANRVEFLGARSDVPDLIAGSMVGIQSSHWEGFGLTAVEIMACGRPLVASSVEGLRQVVAGAGLLFEEGDYYSLAGIVNRLFDDNDFYLETADKCKKRALMYDITTTVEGYWQIYDE